MNIVAGTSAFSSSILKRLLAQVCRHMPHVTDIQAQHIYFLQTNNFGNIKNKAYQLLNNNSSAKLATIDEQQIQVVITQTQDTVPSWSSHAGNLFKYNGIFTDPSNEHIAKLLLITIRFEGERPQKLHTAVEQLLCTAPHNIFYSIEQAYQKFLAGNSATSTALTHASTYTPILAGCFDEQPHDLAHMSVKDTCLHVLKHNQSHTNTIRLQNKTIVQSLFVRDEYVGPYQLAVTDCVITTDNISTNTGYAYAVSDITVSPNMPLQTLAYAMVASALTNLAPAHILSLGDVTLFVHSNHGASEQDNILYGELFKHVQKLQETLGIGSVQLSTVSPQLQYIQTPYISARAQVVDLTQPLTAELQAPEDIGDSYLLHFDLQHLQKRVSGSIKQHADAIAFDYTSHETNPSSYVDLVNFFGFIQQAHKQGLLCAYHDIGSGGLFTTLAQMQFASRLGLVVDVSNRYLIPTLFAQDTGAVLQVSKKNVAKLSALVQKYAMNDFCHAVAKVTDKFDGMTINLNTQGLSFKRTTLQQAWNNHTHKKQPWSVNTECVQGEQNLIANESHSRLTVKTTYDIHDKIEQSPYISTTKPTIALLHEYPEYTDLAMTMSLKKVGFETHNIYMAELLTGSAKLEQYSGLVLCGGLSHGDVFTAGKGWAQALLTNSHASKQLHQFFERDTTFTLGIGNGCHILAQLKQLIPTGENLPHFIPNTSACFEKRTINVRVERSRSVLLDAMAGSILPITVAHELAHTTATDEQFRMLARKAQIALRFVDSKGMITQQYPLNPTGSANGITGVCSEDGRVTMMMTRPHHHTHALLNSWQPPQWQDDGAWLRLFRNARVFVG